jgi:pilus assembly protein CpaF
MEAELIQMHDVFVFEQDGVGGDGHATGRFMATGIRPRCLERIEHRGVQLPVDLFVHRVLDA